MWKLDWSFRNEAKESLEQLGWAGGGHRPSAQSTKMFFNKIVIDLNGFQFSMVFNVFNDFQGVIEVSPTRELAYQIFQATHLQ